MAVRKGGSPDAEPTLIQQLKNLANKYGVGALIVLVFTVWTSWILWNARNYIDRADLQAEANYRIGILEGKMQLLEKNIATSSGN